MELVGEAHPTGVAAGRIMHIQEDFFWRRFSPLSRWLAISCVRFSVMHFMHSMHRYACRLPLASSARAGLARTATLNDAHRCPFIVGPSYAGDAAAFDTSS